MAGNTFGKNFCVTTFGESHGPAIGCVVDGCPPRLPLDKKDLARDLARRRPGSSRHVTQRRESDEAELLSGVFEGITTGAPIAILIRNTDAKSKDYEKLRDAFRPGHADYVYWKKYGIRDHRGSGRASRVKPPSEWRPAPLLAVCWRLFLALACAATFYKWAA